MTKPIATAKFKEATGRDFAGWLVFLKSIGAESLSHKEIASKLQKQAGVDGWWAQSITVAYEQHAGRRQPGQGADGKFTASVSFTVDGEPATLHDRWCAEVNNEKSFSGTRLAQPPSTSATPKRRYWRSKFEDGSNIVIAFETKPVAKTLVTVAHEGLPNPEKVSGSKVYWKSMLMKLGGKSAQE